VWWPHGNYRVIRANERGVLQQAIAPATVSHALTRTTTMSAASHRLREGQRSSARTIWPHGAPLPTPGHPALAMVLTPRDPGKPTWVFPFNRPAAPGPGDNQSMAIATKDGSTVYDVAFALVYADQDTVLNKNEAYAFASCKDCTAVAVSFQVVLIVGNAHVIAPQNISAAVGYNCLRCVTAALAIQLDVSLPNAPDANTAAHLDALWKQIRKFGTTLKGLTFAQIHDQLTAYERQILAIVGPYAKPVDAPASSAPSSGAPGSGAVASTAPAATSSAPAGSSSGSSSPGTQSSPVTQAPSTDTVTSSAGTGDTSSAAPSGSALSTP
jgi:putative peptide zinc metalloprotease protein